MSLHTSQLAGLAADPELATPLSPITEHINPFQQPLESESQPLLAGPSPTNYSGAEPRINPRKPFYRARPLWLVPFALVTALVRGMTTAPRVEVYTHLACNQFQRHYNHTVTPPPFLLNPTFLDTSSYSTIYPTLPYDTILTFSQDNHTAPPNCKQFPEVQATAARIQTTLTITMGILSALTTGWWGQFGQRFGRTRVYGIATLGLIFTDVIFLLVLIPNTPFSTHGTKLLIVAPIVEGLLGGTTTIQAAVFSYVSDCTSPGSRAHIFSRFQGALFLGFALGPSIGSFIIRHTGAIKGVFELSITLSTLTCLGALLLLPESLSEEKMEAAVKDARRRGKQRDTTEQERSEERSMSSVADGGKGWRATEIIRSFLSPLAVFLPVRVTTGGGLKTKRDWSMTFLALAMFFFMLSTGVYQIKYLYATKVYEFGAEQLGYFITALGGARAIHLLFIYPYLIKTFKPKKGPTADPNREMSFDLVLTRISILIDIASDVLVTLAPPPSAATTATKATALFVSASTLTAFGAGANPAMQSLALFILQHRAVEKAKTTSTGTPETEEELFRRGMKEGEKETGRMFGALAVLQAVGQMILGPLLFGILYSSTVGTFPSAIYVVGGGILVSALVLLFLVRPPGGKKGKPAVVVVVVGKAKKKKVVRERGRSTVSKDLRPVGASGSESFTDASR